MTTMTTLASTTEATTMMVVMVMMMMDCYANGGYGEDEDEFDRVHDDDYLHIEQFNAFYED